MIYTKHDAAVSRDCLRFCFTHLVQSDLDAIIHLWNTHRLRRGMNNFGGIPDELYMLPFLNGKPLHSCIIKFKISCFQGHMTMHNWYTQVHLRMPSNMPAFHPHLSPWSFLELL